MGVSQHSSQKTFKKPKLCSNLGAISLLSSLERKFTTVELNNSSEKLGAHLP